MKAWRSTCGTNAKRQDKKQGDNSVRFVTRKMMRKEIIGNTSKSVLAPSSVAKSTNRTPFQRREREGPPSFDMRSFKRGVTRHLIARQGGGDYGRVYYVHLYY